MSRHGDHRDLHSFPTRRSSDLTPTFCSRSASARCSRAWPNARDRKSTRLNSSHLVISYAVFCLKKKILLSVDSMAALRKAYPIQSLDTIVLLSEITSVISEVVV